MEEEWKPIPGYEGYYEVSSHGRVRSLDREVHTKNGQARRRKGRLKKPSRRANGYPQTLLCREGKRKNKYVHRLVLEGFVGPCPDGMECLHIDGNKTNNHVDNLRWGTGSENTLDTVRHRTHNNTRKAHCPSGHELSSENTTGWSKRRGYRSCLACSRARARVRRHPELRDQLQQIADRYHQAIINEGA